MAQDVRPTKPERDLVSECRAQLKKVLKVAEAKAEASAGAFETMPPRVQAACVTMLVVVVVRPSPLYAIRRGFGWYKETKIH